jgi:hypothetical protein
MKWRDGRIYEGQFKNGKKHGYGEYSWPNQKVYKGSWENGKWIKGVLVNNQGISKEVSNLQ